MASSMKFTHDAMYDQNDHINREHDNPSNTEIDPKRTHLNYSFPMTYKGQRPFEYYKQRGGEVYMYGRGTKREKDTITGCGWIITLPKELYGDPVKERAFFQGYYDFIADCYGRENIINNAVHYDEDGLLHIHVDASKKPVNENNPTTWIPLNNYTRMSDYYDEKVYYNSVLNPIKLRHFHTDLQNYLTNHEIEGKVVTGKTGTTFTVKELKDFTKKTGMHLDEVKEMIQDDKSLLQSFVEKDAKVVQLEEMLLQKDVIIKSLKEELFFKNNPE